jgi:hypothetical protein
MYVIFCQAAASIKNSRGSFSPFVLSSPTHEAAAANVSTSDAEAALHHRSLFVGSKGGIAAEAIFAVTIVLFMFPWREVNNSE